MFRARADRAVDCLAGVLLIAATYIYFLLFAQYGFLHLMEQRLSAEAWRPAMATMAIAGLTAGFVTAFCYRRMTSRHWLRWGFSACVLSAAAALFSHSTIAFLGAAAAVGASIAVLTVTLAAGLRRSIPVDRLGLTVGFGTGLAYGICNLPFLFAASPKAKIVAVIVACAAGWIAVGLADRSRSEVRRQAEERPHPSLPEGAAHGWGFIAVTLSFLALIWLDSGAFPIIQETDAWKGHTWGTSARQWTLGLCHLLAAAFAGWWIDRGGFRSLLLSAWALFATAFLVLQHSELLADVTGPIYVLGISFYSTALVAFPSLAASSSRIPRAWQAAWLFGIAGWVGSALGVGMAQDLDHIPIPFLISTGVAMVATAVASPWRRRPQLPPWLRRQASYFVPRILLTVVLVAASAWSEPRFILAPSTPEQTAEAKERSIYIREGCIHCHSQFVRPAETVEWLSRHRRQRKPNEGMVPPQVSGSRTTSTTPLSRASNSTS